MFSQSRKNEKGFSLLELMIVIAIIALLTAVAVPAYRRMVQTARTGEAKSSLAALYVSEMLVQANYQTFASDLPKIGFGVDGNAGDRTYSVGFPTNGAACQNLARFPNAPVAGAGDAGDRIQNGIANYFVGIAVTVIPGNPDLRNCSNTTGVLPTIGVFTAFAAGRLHPANAGNDVWSIDQLRQLRNVRNGVE